MPFYELAILGSPTTPERNTLIHTIARLIEPFGLQVGTDVVIHDETSLSSRIRRLAFAAVFFAVDGLIESEDEIRALIDQSAPIIPTVSNDGDFGGDVPALLSFANGLKRRPDDPDMEELAAALLECVGLLHLQRRVFVSYRRSEARSAAVQLHDMLVQRGFDVFLDTHDIRPAEPFQEVLWHRLVDSDVMIMLDTPTYFESRWTKEEIGRARAKDIQVLRVIWPEHSPNRMTDLSETIYVDPDELVGADGPFTDALVSTIARHTENLRSRSIAARELAIVGKLRADVEKIGGSVEAVGAHRAIGLRLEDGRRLLAYPVVGIPTAEIIHNIAKKAEGNQVGEVPVLVYDHVGIRQAWIEHLSWLEKHISAVRSIKVSDAGWTLAGWAP